MVTSVINGRVVMRNRQVLTLDAGRVMAEANAMGVRVKAAVAGAPAAK